MTKWFGSAVRRFGGSAKTKHFCADTPTRRPAVQRLRTCVGRASSMKNKEGPDPFRSASGQSTTELLLLMPLFAILGGATMYTAFICYQGIKVQQAANYAARVQGQERISGGGSVASIQSENGTGMGYGDTAPNVSNNSLSDGRQGSPPPQSSVYGRFYDTVRSMFGPAVQSKLFIPPPITRLNTDEVQVIRVLRPPPIFGVKFQPIVLEGTAYGGEDTHMYGLPRWGKTDPSKPAFYTTVITNPQRN